MFGAEKCKFVHAETKIKQNVLFKNMFGKGFRAGLGDMFEDFWEVWGKIVGTCLRHVWHISGAALDGVWVVFRK